MKILVTAMALVLAVPAAAQTAPAGHQDHSQHQAGQHAEHAQHGQHQSGQHAQHGQHQAGQHAASGCCADADGDGRMDCCENMAEGRGCEHMRAQPQAQPSGHQNH